ncbi:hypothetical protein M3O75_25130 [Klebsiella pneumoniae]|nr:hypothetical protein [Klebsiella pneumoniae]
MVLGPGKAQTAAEMMNGLLEAAPAAAPTLADVAAEKKQALKGKQTSAVQKFLAKFATIFTPLILYRRRAAAGLRHRRNRFSCWRTPIRTPAWWR